MKVLFTHSYFLNRDPKQLKSGSPYPPLATLYAASLLRKHGFDVRLADLQFSEPEDLKQHLLNFLPDVLVIYDDGFNYLTKMCLTNMREACFKMQELAQEQNIPVIVSSSDASDHGERYLQQGASYVISGEAELTLLELLKNNPFAGNEQSNIHGLIFLKNGKLFKTPAREVARDLDQFPSPAWDLLDAGPYKRTWTRTHGYFSINLVTTRGCPYKCNWCAKPIYGNRYNCHSPARVVQDIMDLQSQIPFEHIWFCDDIFGLKPGWLKEFSKLVNQNKLKLRYKIQSRADLLNEESVRYLAESGCEEVWLGAESGSQKILDAMDKGTTIAQIRESTALLKKAGIKPCFFLQFGYPGENWDDIQKTLMMLEMLQPADIGVSVSYPLPGTKFFDTVKEQLSSKQNWADSDELLMMFRSTYAPDFYRYLQRFVHYKFRGQQLMLLMRHRKFNSRMALLPYYYLRKLSFQKKMRAFEPAAAQY